MTSLTSTVTVEPPFKIWFFYDNNRMLGMTCVTLNDVKPRTFWDISPLISVAITYLSMQPVTIHHLSFWEVAQRALRVQAPVADQSTPRENRPGTPPKHTVGDLVPISVQYEGFGHFCDTLHGHKDVPGIDNVSCLDLRLAVDDFAENMSLVYEDELSRMHRGVDALKNILSARTDGLCLFFPDYRESNITTLIGPHRAAYCVVQFKNESSGSSIPYIDLTDRFARSVKETAEVFPAVVRGWNTPCLGLSVIGDHVAFYAMIHFREWRVVPLARLSCNQASGGGDREALYNAFTAVSVLLARIHRDATRMVTTPPPPIRGKRHLPSMSFLHHPSGSSVEFQILASVRSQDANTFSYIGRTTGGKMISVKFTPRYSYALHAFCTDRGHAPALLGFEKLPGGFISVAVDAFKHGSPIVGFRDDPKIAEWGAQLEALVAAFHVKGLVHGDLRAQNVLCDGHKMMVINFDWAGREGEATYPSTLLAADLMEGRESRDVKITQDDDRRVLCMTLMAVGLGCGYCRLKSA